MAILGKSPDFLLIGDTDTSTPMVGFSTCHVSFWGVGMLEKKGWDFVG